MDKILHGAALGGWAGVDLFFVLSGFLITGILLRTKEAPNFFFNFYMRRTLRILPLYYLFLILAFYVVPQTVQFGFTYWTFLSNILLGRLGQFQSPVLDITWSLAVEEQFYLLWPLVVWATKREKLEKVAALLFFLSLGTRLGLFLSGSNAMKNYVLLICRMDSLCAGAWLACRIQTLSPGFLRKIFFSFLGIVAVIFAMDVGVLSPIMRTVGYSANAVLAASLIGCLCKPEPFFLKSLFGSKFLRLCGKYSFGMYLFHMPLIHWMYSQGQTFWMGFPIQVLFHVLSALGTLLVAMLFYHGYEKHFLRLKKYFENQPELVTALAS